MKQPHRVCQRLQKSGWSGQLAVRATSLRLKFERAKRGQPRSTHNNSRQSRHVWEPTASRVQASMNRHELEEWGSFEATGRAAWQSKKIHFSQVWCVVCVRRTIAVLNKLLAIYNPAALMVSRSIAGSRLSDNKCSPDTFNPPFHRCP
ncbi:hypothetical protein Pst134EA_015734 [Puccinia striiformis f. sp. tritici]|uniref:hypothetical protein n=1 Tax=Puccinia striiformis f. sp. tritici TaxID=168172 RepID=UPI0020089CC7|nr:hypothetical protein Pst134EA_015734 [Puccinia striiformis f. sp. tritici]KAH9463649.1 hypothetical protein Pst134EA_015734 [Puccinia striiformis f. sp. tritici]